MKNWVVSLCLALPLFLTAAGPSKEQMAFYKACKYGAQAKECLRVVDQDGMPVVGAKIKGGLQTGDGYKDYIPVREATDTNGEFVIQGKCTNRIRCGITLDGYYASEFVLPDYASSHTFRDGKWHPYGSRRTIILKKIINPCQLASDDGSCKKPPKLGEWIGYDLELNKWVAPYGGGRYPDMLIRICIDAVDDIREFKTSMEVSFTNNPYAGAYKLSKDLCSEMHSVYRADTNATYQSTFRFEHERHPVVRQHPVVYIEGMKENDTRLDDRSYLVFRTRTKVDENGKLVSAHYGKIEGLWEFFGSMRAAAIQFNPTPNDTNLEDAKTAEYSRMLQRQRNEPPYKKKHKSLWPF